MTVVKDLESFKRWTKLEWDRRVRNTAMRRLNEADRKVRRAMELLSDERLPDEKMLAELGRLRYKIQEYAAGLADARDA